MAQKKLKRQTLAELFQLCEPIPMSGCWIWLGGDNGKPDGLAHGRMYDRERGCHNYVHRVTYELHYGVKLGKSQHVHHECEVRMCCNPDHLCDMLPIHNHLLGRGVETQFKTPDAYIHDPFELAD